MRVSDFNPAAPALRTKPGTMIDTVVPTPACAEMFSDVPESTMFSVEAAMVGGAVAERRLEFATVRHCARRALRQIGVPAVPLLPDADGAPRWPAGVVGSMTHCSGYRAAVVARSDRIRSIGIDAEPHAELPDEARDLVLRAEERARIRALAESDSDLHWERILFCAKEAVYKAWFPLTRRWLDFDDVSATLYPGGTFGARVRVRDPRMLAADRDGFAGRWVVDRGLVVAATSVTS
jgi:4'-phosphopantetheinyl transferase EntD